MNNVTTLIDDFKNHCKRNIINESHNVLKFDDSNNSFILTKHIEENRNDRYTLEYFISKSEDVLYKKDRVIIKFEDYNLSRLARKAELVDKEYQLFLNDIPSEIYQGSTLSIGEIFELYLTINKDLDERRMNKILNKPSFKEFTSENVVDYILKGSIKEAERTKEYNKELFSFESIYDFYYKTIYDILGEAYYDYDEF